MAQAPSGNQTLDSWAAWLNQGESPAPSVATSASPAVSQDNGTETGHLFPESPIPPAGAPRVPSIQVEIDALSQALRRQDHDSIPRLIQTIERNHSETELIEILLAATVNLCR